MGTVKKLGEYEYDFYQAAIYAMYTYEKENYKKLLPSVTDTHIHNIKKNIDHKTISNVATIFDDLIDIEAFILNSREKSKIQITQKTKLINLLFKKIREIPDVQSSIINKHPNIELLCRKGHFDIARFLLILGVSSGNIESFNSLSYFYLYGWGTNSCDIYLASHLLNAAAYNGDKLAQCTLGTIYHLGLYGFKSSKHDAKYWYTLSANQGCNEAQCLLKNFSHVLFCKDWFKKYYSCISNQEIFFSENRIEKIKEHINRS